MKQIINRKMYNTETASEIDYHSNGYYTNDFNYICETLYKKKTGEFFLYGEGGPNTEYAERCCDGWCGGEKITPLTEDEAKDWLEKNSDGDTYIEVFGEPEE